jgi:hypothetical protein
MGHHRPDSNLEISKTTAQKRFQKNQNTADTAAAHMAHSRASRRIGRSGSAPVHARAQHASPFSQQRSLLSK